MHKSIVFSEHVKNMCSNWIKVEHEHTHTIVQAAINTNNSISNFENAHASNEYQKFDQTEFKPLLNICQ